MKIPWLTKDCEKCLKYPNCPLIEYKGKKLFGCSLYQRRIYRCNKCREMYFSLAKLNAHRVNKHFRTG